MTDRPRAQQRWVHSCCSKAKLKAALSDPDISAIEADILMCRRGTMARQPIMAHPPATTSDLCFKEFLERCVNDGTRHLKLDFKDIAAVEPCLRLLAACWPKLTANGQGIWLNADVLPGPNARVGCPVPFEEFVPLCRRMCPLASLSLGWRLGILGPDEAYSHDDVAAMIRMCRELRLEDERLVFAASVRYFEQDPSPFIRLLSEMPSSHLLLWTGSGEMAIRESTVRSIRALFKELALLERVGFDVLLATSCYQVGTAKGVDCTFSSSRFVRWLFGCSRGDARALDGFKLRANTLTTSEAEALLTRGPSVGADGPKGTPPPARPVVGAKGAVPGAGAVLGADAPRGAAAAEEGALPGALPSLPKQTHSLK